MMKLSSVWFVLGLLFLNPTFTRAQGGVVQYAHTYKILYGKDATSAVAEIFAQQNGEEISSDPEREIVTRNLVFSSAKSLMYPAKVDSFEVGDRPNWEYVDTTFVDLNNGTYLQWIDFNADAYLVKDQLPSIPWRLTTEMRTYLGYRVTKATASIDSTFVEAWFSPDIPVPAGPGLYNSLPGLVLLVTNEAIGEVYAAEFVDLEARSSIVEPSTGREVSADEYERIKESEMARSRQLYERLMRERKSGKIKILN
ncbi:MAG: GLPGLI family protein [Bacteroidetes bacterium]|nr:GLPGLI family protein [Bacteroidota bacterium]